MDAPRIVQYLLLYDMTVLGYSTAILLSLDVYANLSDFNFVQIGRAHV